MSNIISLKPGVVWKNFYALNQIPRPSKHEQKAIEYIKQFAEKHKLENIIDDSGNLIVRKPGNNNTIKKGVILQSHVDMVPQKNNDKVHDFLKDPIEMLVDGEWLRANGTTLGADNGMGVAAMMAILESNDIQHGPIECLFTINEESGMDGAFGLASNVLKGDILINLDTEDEDEICMGCAGGIDANIDAEYKAITPEAKFEFYKIELKGLKGGHSGIDIHLGRGNSNKIMGRMLYTIISNFDAQLVNYWGGNMRNAIPREAEAIICLPTDNSGALETTIENFKITLAQEFKNTENNIKLTLSKAEITDKVLSYDDSLKYVSLMHACPNGVVRMSSEIEGLVETSLNLSIVNISNGKVDFKLLIRSAVDSAKYALSDRVKALFELVGCTIGFGGDYPGWAPNNESPVLQVAKSTYNGVFKKEPHVVAVHAGLECGIIGGKYPKLDMVSVGPTIEHPHSPDERVHIASVERFWKYLKAILEGID